MRNHWARCRAACYELVFGSVLAFGSLAAHAAITVSHAPFGKLPDGAVVEQYTLKNTAGMEVRVLTYGGIITSIQVPDRNGRLGDVVLGYDSLEGYVKNPSYFGAVIGRYANRVGKAQFTLDGKTYKLAANNRANSLHGGLKGFDKFVWSAKEVHQADKAGQAGVELSHTSPDGDEGYPGNLSVSVTFLLNDKNELSLDYAATTDKPTIVNLTHHDYFNLAGDGEGDVLGHVLTINATHYTPTDSLQLPTGALKDVAGSPFDFRKPTAIGARIDAKDEQLQLGLGYDHNFVIDRKKPGLAVAATVADPKSGRTLEVRTTEPGVQLYTANHLDGSLGKASHRYIKRGAFCLETEHFPDSPNRPEFPSTVLRPGEKFHSLSVYAFGVK
jgi:aldose 1-epimerase